MKPETIISISGVSIACVALLISCINSYFQFFRNKISGSISVLYCSYSCWVENQEIEIEVDISVSNQGNKPFVVSKILLLHDTENNTQRSLECSIVNGIAMEPDSVVHKKLSFKQGQEEFYRDLSQRGQDETNLTLLIYSIDSKGREFYNETIAAKLKTNENSISKFKLITSYTVLFKKNTG